MGIHGLLPLLKSVMFPVHIEDLRGCSVAVDTYSWLHKGALSCSRDLCKGLPTTRHIDYCMHRVKLLQHHGVKPILVFDGGFLPIKCDQETKRSRSRKENLERALLHESAGNTTAAYECYQKAVDITPSIASGLILVLKKENIDYIVAPYEADAQMTFLFINKYVDAIITEDSDLIPFGCSRIIFKMDKYGQGLEFQYSMLQQNKDMNFTAFTKQMVLEMCILSGCDYLQSLPGMGLKKAHALVQKYRSYDKVIKHLRYSAVSVPASYDESFKKAILSFQHQRVYDPTIEDIVHLTSITDAVSFDLDFLGPILPRSVVKGIATGDLDPFTKLPFQEKMICNELVPDRAYSMKEFEIDNGRRKRNISVKENVLTNYFCIASLEAKRQFKAPRKSPIGLETTETCCHKDKFREETVPCDLSIAEGSQHGSKCSQDTNIKDSVKILTDGNLPEKHSVSDHPFFIQQSESDMSRSFQPLDSNGQYDSAIASAQTKILSRNLIVKSRFFQNNLCNEDGDVNEVRSIPKEDTNNTISDLSEPENAPLESKFCLSSVKRKSLSTIKIQNENIVAMPKDPKLFSEGNNAPNTSSKFMEKGSDQVKFVCNISHLSGYTEIAEKSMEKFVSSMSSFKYVQSGSRASGLRAPMKDASNTCSSRSTVSPLDFSKFSYVSDNQKASSASELKW